MCKINSAAKVHTKNIGFRGIENEIYLIVACVADWTNNINERETLPTPKNMM